MRWLERKPDEPEQCQHAVPFGDYLLYLTADELPGLAGKERALFEPYLDRLSSRERRPPGARAVTYLQLAFPGDLSGAREPGEPGQQPGQL